MMMKVALFRGCEPYVPEGYARQYGMPRSTDGLYASEAFIHYVEAHPFESEWEVVDIPEGCTDWEVVTTKDGEVLYAVVNGHIQHL